MKIMPVYAVNSSKNNMVKADHTKPLYCRNNRKQLCTACSDCRRQKYPYSHLPEWICRRTGKNITKYVSGQILAPDCPKQK